MEDLCRYGFLNRAYFNRRESAPPGVWRAAPCAALRGLLNPAIQRGKAEKPREKLGVTDLADTKGNLAKIEEVALKAGFSDFEMIELRQAVKKQQARQSAGT
jgi:hypothetical protein